ncbi:MAG: ABC-2 transporter permease [Peptostreptococcaceae bacterium]|nr:ABC-2 transporter permease [Peptostreptococcaceae bacterium]
MKNIINLVKMSYSNLNAVKSILLISIILFIVGSIINPIFLNMLIGIIVYQMTYQVIAYEESYGIDYLIASLPVTKKEYITSRYIFGLTSTIISILIFTVTYRLVLTFSSKLYDIIDFKTMLTVGIASSIILVSVLIPSILKFGIVKGRVFITIVGLSIVMAPASLISAMAEEKEAMIFLSKINEIGIGTIFLIVSVVVMIISYIISQKIYRNKQVL